MGKWTVVLVGAPADLEELEALEGGVGREGADFVFRSADLNPLTEAVAVEQAAVQRIEVLKGLLRVMIGDQRVRTVTTNGMYREEEDGTKKFIVLLEPAGLEWQGGIIGDKKALVAAALKNPQIAWALQLFAGEPTPSTLYKVFEVIESDMGKQMVTLGWTTHAAITRFTGTIHSVDHLGVHARHGVQDHPPLPADKVMSVREMRAFIRNLLVRWLESN
jgi:hypothetical protein